MEKIELAKKLLKNTNEADVLLGVEILRQHSNDDIKSAFGKVWNSTNHNRIDYPYKELIITHGDNRRYYYTTKQGAFLLLDSNRLYYLEDISAEIIEEWKWTKID